LYCSFEPDPAALFEAPSVAVQEMLCVPSPVTDRVRLAVPVPPPVRDPIVKPPRESVQLIAVTFDGSVAVTVPVAGEVLNQPLFPLGLKLIATSGGTTSVTDTDAVVALFLLPWPDPVEVQLLLLLLYSSSWTVQVPGVKG